jgi:hypothetical protein
MPSRQARFYPKDELIQAPAKRASPAHQHYPTFNYAMSTSKQVYYCAQIG